MADQLAAGRAAAPSSVDAVAELRSKFVEIEYKYLVDSSFHTDDMRNKFVEFYLLVVGAASTAILGLAQIAQSIVPTWAFSLLACLIGVLGLVMLPMFARARCVVLECLQGTVLLKRYVRHVVEPSGDRSFSDALIWDAHSLPVDERYGTASFVLVFVFMLLDSAMFGLAFLLLAAERAAVPAAILWSLAVGTGLLTLQVAFYRFYLWLQLRAARAFDRLVEKWGAPGTTEPLPEPTWQRAVVGALLVGGTITLLLVLMASRQAPLATVLGL